MRDLRLQKQAVLSVLVMILLLSVRYYVIEVPDSILYTANSDYSTYKKELESIKVNSLSNYIVDARWEPFFSLLMYFTAATRASLDALCFAISLGLTAVFFQVCRFIKVSLFVSFLFTVIFAFSPLITSLSFVAMRQGVSTIFLLIAFMNLVSGRKIAFVSFSGLAIASHLSAIVFVALLLIARWRLSLRALLCVIVPLVVVLYSTNILATQFSWIMPYGLSVIGKSYASSFGYVSGFKWKFIIAGFLSIFPLIINFFLDKGEDRFRYLGKWVAINFCWYMIVSGSPFYDRFAIMSWLLGLVCNAYLISQFSVGISRGTRVRST